ncbi:MAG: acetolactate synthase small subunit [Candidatus Binatia bacterium]
MSEETSYTISILVENEFGVLSRVSGLFSGRGYNISSLSVAETLDPTVSRITLTTEGDRAIVEQINKQLNKLVSVIKVVDYGEAEHVERELALIKVTADSRTRAEVISIASIFRAKIVDVGPGECIVEITGGEEKIRALLELLEPLGVKEIARTGKAALFRGERLLTVGTPQKRRAKPKSKEKAA